jgi:hypothetical protein
MHVSPFMDSLDPFALNPDGIRLGGPVDKSVEGIKRDIALCSQQTKGPIALC